MRRAHKMFCSLASALPRYHTTAIKGREEKNNLSSLNTFFQTPLNDIFSNYILVKAIDKLTQFPICPFIFFFPVLASFDKSQLLVEDTEKGEGDNMQIYTAVLNSETKHISFTF